MRHRLFMLAATLALIAVLGKFYARPLLAQVRAALIQNVDERGRIPYRDTVRVACPPQSLGGDCSFVFKAVPSGKRLVVTNISGFITAASGPQALRLGLGTIENGFPPVCFFGSVCSILTPFFQGSFSGSDFFGVNQNILSYFDAGSQPALDYNLIPGTNFNNTDNRFVITGYLLDCLSGSCAAVAP